MSVQAGGASTIHGIVYQLLWSLLEASTLRIEQFEDDPSSDGSASQAFLILEPRGGGGDTVVCYPDVTVIQQLKAKSTEGSWSLRSVVHEVLPDLYKAVDLDAAQQYEFVTEGRQGDWKAAEFVFHRIAGLPLPNSYASARRALDNGGTVRFGGSLTDDGAHTSEVTERVLFERIFGVLRDHLASRNDSDDVLCQKLWKLLSNLRCRWEQTEAKLKERLLRRLRAVVDRQEDAKRTLNALLMDLANRAKAGNTHVDVDAWFRAQGLDAVPLTAWHHIVSRSADTLEQALPNLGYRPEEDARSLVVPEPFRLWQFGSLPYLVLAGESGQGKTWQTVALARAVSQEDPAVLLSARGDGRADKEEAARLFWQNVCGHDGLLSLDRIAERVRATTPHRSGQWLTLFMDNVLSADEAAEIVRELTYVGGVRVVMSAPPEVATQFHNLFPEKVAVLPVENFTDEELLRYVSGGDLAAFHDIPPDVRETIRRPLLASLYRSLTNEGHWSDTTEYELYARYYKTRCKDAVLRKYRMAIPALRQAALSVWAGKAYPWTVPALQALGFTEPLLNYLTDIGWLRRDERDRYHVWHDRLLNWCVAEAVAEALADGELDAADVGARCADLLWTDRPMRERRLGYVPMDLVWLLAQRGPEMADVLDTVLQQLEKGYLETQGLYERLLPTVGDVIAPAVFRRLEAAEGDNAHLDRRAMAKMLAVLAAEAVAPGAIRLLQSENWELRQAGTKVLAQRPSAGALEPLWARYCVLKREERDGYQTHEARPRDILWEQMDVWSALGKCVALAPDWLTVKINAANAQSQPVGALTAFLRNVPDGKARWIQVKATLRQKIRREDGERHYAYNAFHWRDNEEIGWLKERLSVEEDVIGAYCLRALIRISPKTALAALPQLPAWELSVTRKWTLADLLAQCPTETPSRMRELMNGDDRWAYAAAYADLPDAINEETLDLLLDDLAFAFEQGTAETLWDALKCVAGVCRLPLLRRLWARAGTEWENSLTTMIVEKGPLPGYWHNFMLETATQVLYKVGGHGFTRVVNHWLGVAEPYARLHGILRAQLHPDEESTRLLERIALSRGKAEPGSDSIPQWHSRLAHKALASTGSWEAVVQTIVHRYENVHGDVLSSLPADIEALPDSIMRSAFEALAEDAKHPGAIMALGFGRRSDYIVHITNVLADEDVQSTNDTVNACVRALAMMLHLGPEQIDVLARRLACPEGCWLVVNTLCHDGSERAAYSLLDYVRSELARNRQGALGPSDLEVPFAAIKFVLRQPATRAQAIGLCRNRIAQGAEMDYIAMCLARSLADGVEQEPAFQAALDGERTRAFFADEAFRQDGWVRRVGNKSRSIRGLAAFQRDAAYVAALRVLQSADAHDREYAPYTLLELDRARATTDLLRFLAQKQTTALRSTVARALCGAGAAAALVEAAADKDPAVRCAACFALGFAETSKMVTGTVRACLDDEDASVYEVACQAWHRLEASSNAAELVEAFLQEQDVHRRWLLLDAALDTGDLGDDHLPAPEWVQTMGRTMSPLMADYAGEQIKKHREKVLKEAKAEDDRNKG